MRALLVAELAQLGDLGVAVRVADGLPGARGDLGLVLRLGLKIDEPTRAQKRLGKEAVHACEGEAVQVPGASSLALERRDDHITCLRGQGVDEGILRGAVGDAKLPLELLRESHEVLARHRARRDVCGYAGDVKHISPSQHRRVLDEAPSDHLWGSRGAEVSVCMQADEAPSDHLVKAHAQPEA